MYIPKRIDFQERDDQDINAATMANQVIHFDYGMSPYGQKTKLLLEAAGVQFKRVDQPVVLPRPDLEALGITYRRIPLLAVGKDVYCDSSLIIDIVLEKLAPGKVPTSKADKAWETWGYETFAATLLMMPDAITDNKDFVKDRQTIFPIIAREDYRSLRPSGHAEFISRCSYVENTLLANSSYVGGDKLSMADIHIIFGIRWAMNDLGVSKSEKGVGKDAFPKLWKLIESLPEPKPEDLSSEQAIEAIKQAKYSVPDQSVQSDDPLGMSSGTPVSIESIDAKPGVHPQTGKLIGTSVKEVVLELDSGVHLHFPREGYIVRKA